MENVDLLGIMLEAEYRTKTLGIDFSSEKQEMLIDCLKTATLNEVLLKIKQYLFSRDFNSAEVFEMCENLLEFAQGFTL